MVDSRNARLRAGKGSKQLLVLGSLRCEERRERQRMIYPRDVGGRVFAAILLAAPLIVTGIKIGQYLGLLP